MKKNVLSLICLLGILILFLNTTYNKKTNIDRYRIEELREHYVALVSISQNLKGYNSSINDDNEEIYLRSLLRTSREFEIAINAYKNVLDKQGNRNHGRNVPYIIDRYFDLFIEAANSTDEIDYETLGAIKDDFSKWYMWIEDNYVYTDKRGYLVYKMYTVDDMIKSGLLDEFKLINLEQLNKKVYSSTIY